jgi:hypothetical protein
MSQQAMEPDIDAEDTKYKHPEECDDDAGPTEEPWQKC